MGGKFLVAFLQSKEEEEKVPRREGEEKNGIISNTFSWEEKIRVTKKGRERDAVTNKAKGKKGDLCIRSRGKIFFDWRKFVKRKAAVSL